MSQAEARRGNYGYNGIAMRQKVCPRCYHSSSAGATFCEHCAAPFPALPYGASHLTRGGPNATELVLIIALLGIVASISTYFLSVFALGPQAPASPPASPQACAPADRRNPNAPASVRYVVTTDLADATADVTYNTSSGHASHESNVRLPWSKTFTARPGAFLYISAQLGNYDGEITTTIYVDDMPVKTTTSKGHFVLVVASEVL